MKQVAEFQAPLVARPTFGAHPAKPFGRAGPVLPSPVALVQPAPAAMTPLVLLAMVPLV